MTVGTWREWGDSRDTNDFIKTVSEKNMHTLNLIVGRNISHGVVNDE